MQCKSIIFLCFSRFDQSKSYVAEFAKHFETTTSNVCPFSFLGHGCMELLLCFAIDVDAVGLLECYSMGAKWILMTPLSCIRFWSSPVGSSWIGACSDET